LYYCLRIRIARNWSCNWKIAIVSSWNCSEMTIPRSYNCYSIAMNRRMRTILTNCCCKNFRWMNWNFEIRYYNCSIVISRSRKKISSLNWISHYSPSIQDTWARPAV